jgi:hypothetical protein
MSASEKKTPANVEELEELWAEADQARDIAIYREILRSYFPDDEPEQ